MHRVPEVIDGWFDSGAMPFAQWGYPHQGHERFAEQFPADFISEAIDQTRGWFYSQLAISTLLFGDHDVDKIPSGRKQPFPHPFRNCIVLGLMLGEDGQKMSKSKRNYREPEEIFDRYGADALRWYFFANQPPWTSIRYNEQAIKDSIPEFLLRLWNVYSFFVIYANIDGFDPAAPACTGKVDQLTADELSRAKTLSADRPAERARPLDPERAAPHGRAGDRAHGRLRQLRRLRRDHVVCRRALELVRPPQPRPVLERGQIVARQARRLLDAVRMPADHEPSWSRRSCRFWPKSMWQNLAVAGVLRLAACVASKSVHLCDYPTARLRARST